MDAASSVRWLRAGYEIDCDGQAHGGYQVYATLAILAFPVGIPTLYAWLLRHSLNHLRTRGDIAVGKRVLVDGEDADRGEPTPCCENVKSGGCGGARGSVSQTTPTDHTKNQKQR